MAKQLPDYPVFDFSRGIRRDVSPYQLKDNELQSGRNFEIDEQGRIKKRRGSVQFGTTISGSILNTHYDNNGFFISNNAGTGVIYKLFSGILTDAITTSSTQVNTSISTWSASGTVEIEGDLITYTGVSTTNLTGVTGITSSHSAGVAIHQWQAMTYNSGSIDCSQGTWFAYLNSKTVAIGRAASMFTYAGSGLQWTAMTDGDRPYSMFAEIFGDRLFTVGDGTAGYSSQTVYFSDLGDATSWTSGNNFTIEDTLGEPISCIKYYNKNLLDFKLSSFYAFTGSLPVRQISNYYGVYNEFCVQEIDRLLYGVGPNGVFVSNGITTKSIGEPIVEYLKDFNVLLNSTLSNVTNIFTAQTNKKFYIYIGDTTSAETMNDVTLVYDTAKKSWSIDTGWTDMTSFGYLPRFNSAGVRQYRGGLFFGTSTKFYRAFENRFREITTGAGVGSLGGSDLYSDLFSNTGTPITMNVVTKPFTLKTPHIRKQFRFLKTFSEVAGIQVSYKIDGQTWKPLGKTSGDIDRFEFPSDAIGRRCAIALDESSTNPSVIFNGMIFEDTIALDKNM